MLVQIACDSSQTFASVCWLLAVGGGFVVCAAPCSVLRVCGSDLPMSAWDNNFISSYEYKFATMNHFTNLQAISELPPLHFSIFLLASHHEMKIQL